jgi:hypothetical protein
VVSQTGLGPAGNSWRAAGADRPSCQPPPKATSLRVVSAITWVHHCTVRGSLSSARLESSSLGIFALGRLEQR